MRQNTAQALQKHFNVTPESFAQSIKVADGAKRARLEMLPKEEVEHVLTLKKKDLVDLLVSMGIDADCIKKAKLKADLIALYRE